MSIVRLLHLSRFHLSSATQHWLDDVTERQIQIDDRGREREWIRTGGAEVMAVPIEYGWLVYGNDPATMTAMTPHDLFEVIRFAHDRTADWIQLDADGESYEALPFYDDD